VERLKEVTYALATQILISVACFSMVAAIKLQCMSKIKRAQSESIGQVNQAYQLGLSHGAERAVNHMFGAILQSIDSGCDVSDLRDGMVNQYVPLIHRDRKVDA